MALCVHVYTCTCKYIYIYIIYPHHIFMRLVQHPEYNKHVQPLKLRAKAVGHGPHSFPKQTLSLVPLADTSRP